MSKLRIVIEGPQGSGKSALAALIRERIGSGFRIPYTTNFVEFTVTTRQTRQSAEDRVAEHIGRLHHLVLTTSDAVCAALGKSPNNLTRRDIVMAAAVFRENGWKRRKVAGRYVYHYGSAA